MEKNLHFYLSHCNICFAKSAQNLISRLFLASTITQTSSKVVLTGIKIIDFQTPDKTSDTIKYLPDILKIHQTLCQCAWVLKFKRPQLVYLLKCIMTTFNVHKYSFSEINTYCVIIFLLEKSYSHQKAINK